MSPRAAVTSEEADRLLSEWLEQSEDARKALHDSNTCLDAGNIGNMSALEFHLRVYKRNRYARFLSTKHLHDRPESSTTYGCTVYCML